MDKKLFLIWSIEHGKWWCPLSRGYCIEKRNAGTYTFEEALKILKQANFTNRNTPNEAMVEYKKPLISEQNKDCKNIADVCELAHCRTVYTCRKLKIKVDKKISKKETGYTKKAQEIFNCHYDNIMAQKLKDKK